jgi:hypothetical protein
MMHPQANFGIMGETIDPKTKRRRGNLPKPVTDILRAWFHEHLDHPYPSEEDKQMFMTRTGLSISQVRTHSRCSEMRANKWPRSVIGSLMRGGGNCQHCATKCEVVTETRRAILPLATSIRDPNCHRLATRHTARRPAQTPDLP